MQQKCVDPSSWAWRCPVQSACSPPCLWPAPGASSAAPLSSGQLCASPPQPCERHKDRQRRSKIEMQTKRHTERKKYTDVLKSWCHNYHELNVLDSVRIKLCGLPSHQWIKVTFLHTGSQWSGSLTFCSCHHGKPCDQLWQPSAASWLLTVDSVSRRSASTTNLRWAKKTNCVR